MSVMEPEVVGHGRATSSGFVLLAATPATTTASSNVILNPTTLCINIKSHALQEVVFASKPKVFDQQDCSNTELSRFTILLKC